TKRGLDDRRIERSAADGIDVVPRVAIVGREMKLAGLIVDHAAGHRDRVLEDFVRDPKLLQSVNPTGGEGEVDRAAADNIALARIGTALVQIDVIPAPAKISGQQSPS